MASGTVFVAMPIVAAGIGLYLCERNGHNNFSTSAKEEERRGQHELAAKGKVVVELEVKPSHKLIPKLAPQFDGLDCFETFVGRL